jgi:PST family polysaccharide transporter
MRPEDPRAENLSTEELDRRIIRGSAWVAVGYGGRNLASVLGLLILVRVLEPSAFGLVALTWTFMMIASQVQGSGVWAALVYRRHDHSGAAATAFLFTLFTGLMIYGVLFAASPVVAWLFHEPQLTGIFRVMGLLVVLRAIGSVPIAILDRSLRFGPRARCEVAAAVSQLGVSIGLAFAGAGVWSLVAGQLAGQVAITTLAWAYSSFRPQIREASLRTLRELVAFGRFVSGTQIVTILSDSVDNLVIGRVLGATSLGFYNLAYRLAEFPNIVIGQIVSGGRLMFPVYSLLQGDLARIRRAYVQSQQRIALFALPMSVILVLAAHPIVVGLFGAGWTRSVTPLWILGIYGLVRAFAAPSNDLLQGAGRPHLSLLFGLVHLAVAIPCLVILVPAYGLAGGAGAMLAAAVASGALKYVVGIRLIELRGAELARALAPSFLCAGVLALVLAVVRPAADALSPWAGLVLLVSAGAAAYLAATAVFARSVLAPVWVGLRGVRAS